MATDNYHLPYCNQCKQFVSPQVVSSTHVHGGSVVSSHVTYDKFCPNCGGQVFSQSDIDEYNARKVKNKAQATQYMIIGVAVSGVCFPPLALIPAIAALVLASKNRPLSTAGQIGVAISWIVVGLYILAALIGIMGLFIKS